MFVVRREPHKHGHYNGYSTYSTVGWHVLHAKLLAIYATSRVILHDVYVAFDSYCARFGGILRCGWISVTPEFREPIRAIHSFGLYIDAFDTGDDIQPYVFDESFESRNALPKCAAIIAARSEKLGFRAGLKN